MLVCHCKRVCDGTIRQSVRNGARTAEQVGAECRAGTGCGGCRPLIDLLIDEEAGELEGGPGLTQIRVAS
ncbi:MAG: (2Fe-2S)-binding protein [Myxococcota bacterium]